MARKPKKKKAPAENTLFPGLPNYTGPQHGWFAMLHHTMLFERAHANGVNERVDYVTRCKPRREVKVRLRNMLYIGDCPVLQALDRITKARKDLRAAVARDTAQVRDDLVTIEGGLIFLIRPLVLAYINEVNPKHSWVEGRGVNKGYGKIKGTTAD